MYICLDSWSLDLVLWVLVPKVKVRHGRYIGLEHSTV